MKRVTIYDTFMVPTEKITFDREFNCRGSFSVQSVSDIAQSIRDHGLQTPISIRSIPAGKFFLLAGHRRFEAVTTILKWTEIPSIIRDDLTLHQARIFNLTENLERKDLNILEEALALQKIYPEGTTLRVAARELKRPTRWVQCRQRVLMLSEPLQQMVATGMLSALNIESLWKLDECDRESAAKQLIEHKQSKGKTRAFRGRLQRTFKQRKTKAQLSYMIEHLYNVKCIGINLRLLAWAAGRVTDQEIEAEIKNEPTYRDPGPNYIPTFIEHSDTEAALGNDTDY